MRLKPALLVLLAPLALAACHSHGGYFESDPVLALGPGCPDCPSRARWPAYFGTGGESPKAEEIRTVAVVRPEPVQTSPIAATYRPAPAVAVVAAPPRPLLTATARPAVVRSSSVEAPRLDVDFGLGGGQVVARPAPDPEPPVAPPVPGAPLPPPTPGSQFRFSDMPGYGR